HRLEFLREVNGRRRSPSSGGRPASPESSRRPEEAAVPGDVERLLTIVELSEMLGIPVDTLYGWRHRGEGPQGYRIGRHVRYRRAAVEDWLEGRLDPARG
ncbi:MAG: helix-turn-helix domain-containing protein, partial [Propionibacteriaceae bacterium]